MEKTRISNVASVGIIFNATNPSQIFIEMKDGGHPIKLVRGQLCPIGGNWIGEAAKADRNTRDTFLREVDEELSFERPIRDSIELALLGQAGITNFTPTPAPTVKPTARERQDLEYIKAVIKTSAFEFGDYLDTVSKDALDAADPENKRDGFTTLASYWQVPLERDQWQVLTRLQKKFGNLSNESITLVTSLDEIVRTGTKTAFGHDGVLKLFFQLRGYVAAQYFPLVAGVKSVFAGPPLATYEAYLEKYDVAKKPAM